MGLQRWLAQFLKVGPVCLEHPMGLQRGRAQFPKTGPAARESHGGGVETAPRGVSWVPVWSRGAVSVLFMGNLWCRGAAWNPSNVWAYVSAPDQVLKNIWEWSGAMTDRCHAQSES